MAKYIGTLSVNSRCTFPFDIAYDIYKGGVFEGYGDCSYISLKIGGKEVERALIRKEKLDVHVTHVRDFISFIQNDRFDIISQKELNFIKSDTYRYLVNLLGLNTIKFNNDNTELSVMCHECGYTTEDVGKYIMDFYHCTNSDDLRKVWNDSLNNYEEFYVGNVTFRDLNTYVDIPIIRPDVKKVEIMQIKADVNIFKCFAFVGKLNALYEFLYEKKFANYVVWNYVLNFYNYNLENKLSYFNPNFCSLKIMG